MRGINSKTGKALSGIEHLRQSIRDILTTPLGSRVMRRNYGSRLFDLVDNPLNEQTLVEIFAATAEALQQWEPRLKVTRVQARAAEAVKSVVAEAAPVTPVVSKPKRLFITGDLSWYSEFPVPVPIEIPENGEYDGKPYYELAGPFGFSAYFLSGFWLIEGLIEGDGGGPYQVGWRSLNSGSWETPDLVDVWTTSFDSRGTPTVELLEATVDTPAPSAPSAPSDTDLSAGRILVDLEAIYLPTGEPIRLDGIVIK